jgi:hypothetical protein
VRGFVREFASFSIQRKGGCKLVKIDHICLGLAGYKHLAIHDDHWFKKKITAVTMLVLCRTLSINDETLN